MNRYHLYLDFLELRRRAERRLASPRLLLLHTLLFHLVMLFWYVAGSQPSAAYTEIFSVFRMGHITVWTFALLAHSLWVFLRSGIILGQRERAVEAEMRAQAQANDAAMLDEGEHLFEVHGLLVQNMGQRAWPVPVLLLFNALTALGWVISANGIAGWSSTPFQLTVIGGLGLALLLLGIRYWNNRQERHIRQQIERLPKSKSGDYDARLMLSDDGELVEYPPLEAEKPKRERA
jgi:hypothetical protein